MLSVLPRTSVISRSARLLSTTTSSSFSTLSTHVSLNARATYKLDRLQRRPPALFSQPNKPAQRSYSMPIPACPYSGPKQPDLIQSVEAPLTREATFLILTLNEQKQDAASTVRDVLGDVSDLAKNLAVRDGNAAFTVTIGIGAKAWDSVMQMPRPKELHPFKEFKGNKHTAVSTPGDLLVHIRANRRDMVFEFERQFMNKLGDSVKVEDAVAGFRYFDGRDLLGFVDGTANPVGQGVPDAVRVTENLDPNGIDGTYVTVQKYLHNLDAWGKLKTEEQEAIIGRTKLDNIETPDQPEDAQKPHKQLNTIEVDGQEYDILRDNMPFGDPSSKEYGTYFIGYSARLWVTEKMLENMFIGVPPGKYDRILDFSDAVTGCTFFVPNSAVLNSLG
ncbi:hypothetical protein A1Q2_07420 [Trichosporon asahii var. asahii CBS 8904]|uniref:Iron-dependent peroxidase n=1 Tax=Trichosporon asahii var. asahii (strain CBS 8904) TaxID=1220162 RepID=K1VH25_TRIAC|nr:hypothetical protein A1Q2_07420 [Trichosporon asahii var. asahii CBS 8904]